MIFPAVWLNLQNSAADMWNQSIAPRNPRHSPFKHHQQHPHSHPTRNTPGHLPAEHLPPKSALEHHQIHPWQPSQPLLRSSAATNTPHRTFNSTTPSATPQATPCATPADHIRDQIPPATPTQTPLTTLPNHLRDQALLSTPHTTPSATPSMTPPTLATTREVSLSPTPRLEVRTPIARRGVRLKRKARI